MRRTLPVIIVLLLVVAGCGSAEESRSERPGGASPGGGASVTDPAAGRETDEPVTTSEAGSFDELVAAADHMEVWALTLTVAIDEHVDVPGDPHSRSAELLATFDALLRKHEVLVAFASEAVVAERHEDLLAAVDSLNRNTEELALEFTALYERSTGEEFTRLWEKQVEAYIHYAEGVALDDEATKQGAAEDLEVFIADFAEFMEDVTGGEAGPEEISRITREHVDSTLEMIERWQVEGEDAFAAVKDATDVMKRMGERIAEPIAVQHRLEGDVTSDAATLRAELSGRMLENPSFLAFATRSRLLGQGEDARPRFDRARALVDQNTNEIGEIVRERLGEEHADAFEELWTEHNDLLVDYAEAAAGNRQDRGKLLDELASWSKELGVLFERATNGKIGATAVEKEAAKHVETVRATIDEQVAAVQTRD